MSKECIKILTTKDKSLYQQMYFFIKENKLDTVEIRDNQVEIKLIKLYEKKEEYNIIKRFITLLETYTAIYKFIPGNTPELERVTSYKNYREEE